MSLEGSVQGEKGSSNTREQVVQALVSVETIPCSNHSDRICPKGPCLNSGRGCEIDETTFHSED